MLLGLRLQNIALIESLNLSFNEGFSVFTGETGAGKSVFLFSIDSLLGGGGSSSGSRLMRPGSTHSVIEACFLIDSKVREWLQNNSFEVIGSEIFISRDWKLRDGRITSRIRLNGEIINLKQVLSLRRRLIDVSEQGHSHLFNSAIDQLKLLDRFGSSSIEKLLAIVKVSWENWCLKRSQLENAIEEYKNTEAKLSDIHDFLLDIDQANINDPLEESNLKLEQDKLVHGVKLQESLTFILSRLKESSDDLPSALDHFSVSIKELKTLIKIDKELTIHFNDLLETYTGLEDFLVSLEHYKYSLDSNPNQLESIQTRLAEIKKIKNRYGLDLQELLIRRDQYREQLDLEDSKQQLNTLRNEEKKAKSQLDQYNSQLTQLRKSYALKLEEELVYYLKPLGLDNVRFKVQFSDASPSQTGADFIRFLFSANEGQPLAPFAEVVSGGEMSRFLLVMTTMFAEESGASTLIFDEIDSGVSGRISSAIAKLLKDLSRKKQVFCITHQPLVAASADHHFSVSKTVDNGMTNSKVLLLKEFGDRQHELAKLAGGNFDQAFIFAASLLDNKAA